MTDHVCPFCSGAKRYCVFADWHDGDGELQGGIRYVDCFTCKGVGTITQDRVARIERGKQLKAERVARGQSFMDAAEERGVSPAQVSAEERGEL